MRIARPGTGTILGGLAPFVALSGTAAAAAPTVVNIADPTAPAQKAKVAASGALKVGDGSGPLTVDGTTQVAAPTAFCHTAAFGLSSTTACIAFATPAAGKALIIRNIQVDVFNDPTPGEGQHMYVYADASCSIPVADVYPPGIGVTVLPPDPGVAIPAGSACARRWAERSEPRSSSTATPCRPPLFRQPPMFT